MLAKVPPHYQQCYKRYASEGARVLAMAYKQLPSEMTPSELRHLPRDHAESELVFAGQLVAAYKEDRQPRNSPASASLQQSAVSNQRNHQISSV